MSRRIRWDSEAEEWVDEEEYKRRRIIYDILDNIIENLEFEIEFDLKTGKGKIKLGKKGKHRVRH